MLNNCCTYCNALRLWDLHTLNNSCTEGVVLGWRGTVCFMVLVLKGLAQGSFFICADTYITQFTECTRLQSCSHCSVSLCLFVCDTTHYDDFRTVQPYMNIHHCFPTAHWCSVLMFPRPQLPTQSAAHAPSWSVLTSAFKQHLRDTACN